MFRLSLTLATRSREFPSEWTGAGVSPPAALRASEGVFAEELHRYVNAVNQPDGCQWCY